MTSLAERTVLVTGANRGMGREYVAQLLGRKVAKVYAATRNPLAIDVSDPRVIPLQLDVTDAVSVAEAADLATDVGILINNAGISRASSVLDKDTSAFAASWRRTCSDRSRWPPRSPTASPRDPVPSSTFPRYSPGFPLA